MKHHNTPSLSRKGRKDTMLLKQIDVKSIVLHTSLGIIIAGVEILASPNSYAATAKGYLDYFDFDFLLPASVTSLISHRNTAPVQIGTGSIGIDGFQKGGYYKGEKYIKPLRLVIGSQGAPVLAWSPPTNYSLFLRPETVKLTFTNNSTDPIGINIPWKASYLLEVTSNALEHSLAAIKLGAIVSDKNHTEISNLSLISDQIVDKGLKQPDPDPKTGMISFSLPSNTKYTLQIKGEVRTETLGASDERDFGDAPDSYKTTTAKNGPRYRESIFQRLGETSDREPDGQPTERADGDDMGLPLDDEDGVIFGDSWVDVIFNITRPGSNEYQLRAWWDTNENRMFNHPGDLLPGETSPELYINDLLTLEPGKVTRRYALPFNPKDYYSRFRLTWDPLGDVPPFGEVFSKPDCNATDAAAGNCISHGEVEDYAPAPVPEPSSILGLLAFGGLGLTGFRKKRQ